MGTSKRLRFEILRRDDYTCRYCGRAAPEVKLTVDHVQPVALGGRDDPSNLVTACHDCNSGKSSIPVDADVVADVANDALKWARAIEAVAWGRSQQRYMADDAAGAVELAWLDWHLTVKGETTSQLVPRPADWLDTVHRLYASGLDAETMVGFVGLAMRKRGLSPEDTWTYFCGCCWRELDAIQEEARRVIAVGEEITASWESNDGA